ncbi:MAG: hypothetical protein LBT05_02055 [Planctomycetaceae bacterium]|jgi:hypothetical protein|nr:hypothetical protein [Planctomycetaceae bacterium]
MGQFLAIGLAQQIVVSNKNLEHNKITLQELRTELQTNNYDLDIYDETTNEESIIFTLKESVIQTDLIPFLESFYPKFYGNQSKKYTENVLEQLRAEPTQWLDFAKRKSEEAFQWDNDSSYYLCFTKPFHPYISLSFSYVILSLGGKIMSEGISQYLDFFKYCIQETFKEHPIAKSVRPFITE